MQNGNGNGNQRERQKDFKVDEETHEALRQRAFKEKTTMLGALRRLLGLGPKEDRRRKSKYLN